MNETNIIGLIKSIKESLPKAEKKIADFIINWPEETIYLSAKELGEKSGSSAPTVIRFCRRLDVDGFTQLKLMLSSELSSLNKKGYSDITENESFTEIKNKLLGNAHQALLDTASLINEAAVMDAVILIEQADILYIYGIGSSYLVAKNFAQKWSRIGKNCIVESDPHILIAAMTGNNQKALFVAISNSGETSEVVKLTKLARRVQCKSISITHFGKNLLSEFADVSINHSKANEQLYRSAATASLHVQFYVIDILFHSYATKHYKNTIDKVLLSRKEIENYNQNA
ncbi:MurR/RpiR family transcriptional regulator [Aerococcaceae bacterium WGS1372]